MAFNEALAERIRRLLARCRHVEEKKMFGGVGFLLHGNLLVGVWKDSLCVRLGPDQAGRRCWNRTSMSSTSPAGR
jgi:TfoX/Sxy family transcriptional regulator of competence genes